MSTPGLIGVCFECFLLNKLPHVEWWTLNWPYYSSQIDGSNDCFSKMIADVLPLWHCVNTPEGFRPANWQNFCFYEGAHQGRSHLKTDAE